MEKNEHLSLNKLWSKGKNFLKVNYPIISGAMSWISERNLVSSVSNAGGFGVLAGGGLSQEELKKELIETRKLTDKNFGLNLIVISPRFEEQMNAVLDDEIEYIILAGGIPEDSLLKRLKEKGKKVIAFASNRRIAEILVNHDIDALIIEGTEAGGHIGNLSTMILLQEVLLNIKEVPVFVAGGIATGEIIAALFMLGAAGVQLGTKFCVANESIAHQKFKKKLLRTHSHNTVINQSLLDEIKFSPVRCIKNDAVKEFNELQLNLMDQYKSDKIYEKEYLEGIEEFWIGKLRSAVIDGDIKKGSLMAGESIGLIKKNDSVKNIIEELVYDAEKFIKLNCIQKLGL